MTMQSTGPASRERWQAVCRLEDLVPERGAAALVDGEQVALVRLVDDTVLAVQNLDPFSGAHVMSRGIVGTRGDEPTLASPMYKQVFDLRTGRCLETAGYAVRPGLAPDLRTWRVEVRGGVVHVDRLDAGAEAGPAGAGPQAAA
jgi:nitrite reductase (NADH) small subunit